MIEVNDFLQKNNLYEIPTTYYKVNEDWETYICFYNFYNQIFPKTNWETDLYFIIFDKAGRQISSAHIEVGCGGSVSVPLSRYVRSNEGIVGVMAIPKGDIVEEAKNSSLVLRGQVSTGYYTMWENRKTGTLDTSHEWAALLKSGTSFLHMHCYFNPSEVVTGRKLIFYNMLLTGSKVTRPEYDIYVNNTFIGNIIDQNELGPRGTQVLDVHQLLSSMNLVLKAADSVMITVKGDNLSPPFTLEEVSDKDFHIHHV